MNFDRFVVQHPELQRMIEVARPSITESVRGAIIPFFAPGNLPSREQFKRLERWAPLIEMPGYRFCARALDELASWRASALAEAEAGNIGKKIVLERYYALTHTVAHLTLLCSQPGATPWLSDMARSFTWKNWTPTFPLVRERTVWLAAAGARSAIAFGADVADRYVDALDRATQITQLFDALFALAAIGLSDPNASDRIVGIIAGKTNRITHRLILGAELSEATYRSAIACLSSRGRDVPEDRDILDRLQWKPNSSLGLGTSEAFRLDPTYIDETGQMIGFRALPYVLRAKIAFHYPVDMRNSSRLLPVRAEMPELLLRAWKRKDHLMRTIH